MTKYSFLICFHLCGILSGVLAQKSKVSFQNQGLYEVNTSTEMPNINGFYALDLFHEDIDNSVWISPEKQCVNMTLTKAYAQDGEHAIMIKWNKDDGGCKWIGMGFGWNNWEPKELSLVGNQGAIQFYARSLKDTLKTLPWALALEDYSGVQAYTGFSPRFLANPITPNAWTKVTIPISSFPIEAYDLDLSLIKQFIMQFEAEGEILVDNFTIVPYTPPAPTPTKSVGEAKPLTTPIKNAVALQPSSTTSDPIEALIQSMSIEEKVGQMTQVDLGVISVGDICQVAQPHRLDEAKLQKAVVQYKVGSILNCGCGTGTLPIDKWRAFITQIQTEATKTPHKIPVLYGVDAVHGVNYTIGATLFPQQLGQAATWNPELVEKGAQVTAYECRASYIPWNFSPILDVARQPLWSRFFETYGADVYLAKTMGTASVKGYQGTDLRSPYSVAACGKHFLGYSMPFSGKDRTPAYLAPRDVREYFLPSFQAAIDAGLQSVMINSGEISGTPVHANYDILTKLLREELKFEGIAVTDWGDIEYLHTRHKVAATMREAVKMAIMAGIDMSMVPNNFEFTALLIDLVKKGEVPESRIDASVRRILTVKMKLGLFENPYPKDVQYTDFGSAKFAKLSYESAAESITLLKNKDNVLPLASGKKVLVCGPAAHSMNLLNGAWTHTWLGTDTTFNTKGKLTIKQALEARMGKNAVTYVEGSTLNTLSNLAACTEAAKNSDYIVVCLGEAPSTEIPGNIESLNLPQAQVELVKALSALNKPLVLVMMFNRPRVIKEVVGLSQAVLAAYLPGDMGGEATADILIGNVNPSGKLPFTWPSDAGDVIQYDHKATEDQDTQFGTNAYHPLFDFGTGLSYTTFAYSNLTVSKPVFSRKDKITVQVTVKNTGKTKGKEVVQLYYRDHFASITPAVKKLCGFTKIELAAGEEKNVSFTLTAEDFSFVSKELKRITEAGDFDIMVHSLTQKITLQD